MFSFRESIVSSFDLVMKQTIIKEDYIKINRVKFAQIPASNLGYVL